MQLGTATQSSSIGRLARRSIHWSTDAAPPDRPKRPRASRKVRHAALRSCPDRRVTQPPTTGHLEHRAQARTQSAKCAEANRQPVFGLRPRKDCRRRASATTCNEMRGTTLAVRRTRCIGGPPKAGMGGRMPALFGFVRRANAGPRQKRVPTARGARHSILRRRSKFRTLGRVAGRESIPSLGPGSQ